MQRPVSRAVLTREILIAVLGTAAATYVPLEVAFIRDPELFRDMSGWFTELLGFVGLCYVVAFLLFYRVVRVAKPSRAVAVATLLGSVAAIPWGIAVALAGFDWRLLAGFGQLLAWLAAYSLLFTTGALVVARAAFRAATERSFVEVLLWGATGAILFYFITFVGLFVFFTIASQFAHSI
jgi:hypothetical protein